MLDAEDVRGNELYDLDFDSTGSAGSMYLTELWREDSFDEDVFDLALYSKLFDDFSLEGELFLCWTLLRRDFPGGSPGGRFTVV